MILGLSLSLATAGAQNVGLLRLSELLPEHPLEKELLRLSNQQRQALGIGALSYDESLAIAARNHAKEMLELNYISHESPLPEHKTLSQRLSLAGSPAQGAGENLGQVLAKGDVAQSTITGWMDSPHHRENLLDPDYTHVGFGVAADDTYVRVVQVLAVEPLLIERALLRSNVIEYYDVIATINLKKASEAIIFYGDAQADPSSLETGRHHFRFSLEGNLRQSHVRLGARANTTQSGFILQDDGWLDPIRNTWQSGGQGIKDYGSLDSVSAKFIRARNYRIELELADLPERKYGVWVNDLFEEKSQLNGKILSFSIPDAAAIIELGLKNERNHYDVLIRLKVQQVNGEFILAPAGPRP
ncbi:MAG: CAP domain-containing protein [Deinococcales bacterium]